MEIDIDTAIAQFKPHFMLIPSLSCPAACRYCFGPNTGPAMDIRMVKHTVDYMDSVVQETGQDKVRVTFHGGEPLAAGHDIIEALVKEIYDRFFGLGIDIGLQSNLWLLDDRYCELFKEYGVSISTSLDGPEEINDGQRGNGYYKKTVQGIQLAASYGLRTGCIATFTSVTAPRYREILDFFQSRSFPFSVHPSVAAIGRKTGLELTNEQYWTLFNGLFNSYIENRKSIKIESYDQICQGIAFNEGRVCTFRDCFGMFLAIDPNGDIYSCQRFAGKSEYRLGNIMDRPSMNDLANSPAARQFLQREALMHEQCGECEHFGYCKGGCPYNAAAAGQFMAVDPYCESYKQMFSLVSNKLHEEMVSDENFRAISELGPSERGNPLLRVGPVTDLTDEHAHPYFIANAARRTVTAYELAKSDAMDDAARHLMEQGFYPTQDAARSTLMQIKNQMQPSGSLNKLYIHVTWRCQLHCSHCYASAGSGDSADEMETDHIITMIMEAANCGFKEVVLTGGEPLLLKGRTRLLDRLARIRRDIKPVKIILRTNFAMPLSGDDHIQLAKAFDEIVVSIDGGEEDHDDRRGKGAYGKTVANLKSYTELIGETLMYNGRRIRPARLSLSATMRAGDVNTERGYAVNELGRKLNIRHVKFRPLLPLGRALHIEEPITSEALRSYLTPLDLLKEGFSPVYTCGIGQNLYVEPSGEAFPCYSYHKPHTFLGNVIRDGLKNIIERGQFQALQSCTVDSNYGCRKCEYRYLCGGACRAWGREATQNDLNAAPVECDGLRKRATELYTAASEYLLERTLK